MLSDSLSKQGLTYADTKDIHKCQSAVRRKPGRPPKLHPPGTINGIVAECAVCHDKATGLHYAVMTCEGCKGFFKRSIQADKIYKCRNRTECVINKETRNACQACRMKRCFDMGMKEKLVRDDRTPGNRKKKYGESLPRSSHHSSENNSVSAMDFLHSSNVIKQENTCMDRIKDEYSLANKKRFDDYSTDYCGNLSGFDFGNISMSTNLLGHDIHYHNVSPMKQYDGWDMPRLTSDMMSNDSNATDVIQHISSMCEPPLLNVSHVSEMITINCSGDQELPLAKCRQNPKCLMHLLTRLMKAKPVEPAFCKYFDRFPSSEQFLDCLADEIHLIIKFAKKTPGFCDLTMSRKLNVVQKHALGILFIRIIYRSLTCPLNHVQFASNICLNYNDFDKIEILSYKFRQTLIELILSFRSLNLDIYELCLIQYAIIEDEDENWNPEMRYYPILDGFDRPTCTISQKYLKLYTSNKYPDQPHRWMFIMLSVTQVQEMVKLFIHQCLDMVNAQRMVISNDIVKEILSL